MTKKSKARLASDAAKREAAGGRVKTLSQSREITSRSWFELKQVHRRSSDNLVRVAGLLGQYNDPIVLMKVSDNGDTPRFNALHLEVQERMKVLSVEFNSMHDGHKNRKGASTSVADMQAAAALFDRYQAFDVSILEQFQPIVNDLSEIYNRAMRQLEEIRQQVATEQSKEPMDVEFREVPVAEQQPT